MVDHKQALLDQNDLSKSDKLLIYDKQTANRNVTETFLLFLLRTRNHDQHLQKKPLTKLTFKQLMK